MHVCVCVCIVFVQSLSCVWLFVTPMDCSMPGFCPSPSLRVCSNSCPLSRWCHLTVISSSAAPFSSCSQSFPSSGSFLMSQLFTSGGQIIGVSASASVPPMNRALQRCLKPWLLNAFKMTGMKRSWFITLKIDREAIKHLLLCKLYHLVNKELWGNVY